MDNTLANRDKFNTSTEPQIRGAPMANGYQPNQGELVFFQTDLMEMFGVNLDYPGIRGAINAAFMDSRRYIPVDTGLMRKSYTLRVVDDSKVECFFDPKKIVGQMRKGQKVKDYYPQWVGSSGPTNRAWNWLTIVMNHYYDTLISGVRKLRRSKEAKKRAKEGRTVIDVTSTALMVLAIIEERRKREAKERKEAEEAKRENDKAAARLGKAM